ncbi:hypothetical protein TGVAND_240940 [Toxoplasma gondii VAND]|uniref:Uncharacterized protein n=1 Tax=Toxoplasma gondii VAND TaxID=933077 RepID=A0A086PVQ2_TOXGO|nr:hypothetical protein TGVAND_240940 [Toxoplasma gondii VAND]
MPGRTQRGVLITDTATEAFDVSTEDLCPSGGLYSNKNLSASSSAKGGSGRGYEVDETRARRGLGGDRREAQSLPGRTAEVTRTERGAKNADWKGGNWGNEGKHEKDDCRGTAKQKWTKKQTEQPPACAEQSDWLWPVDRGNFVDSRRGSVWKKREKHTPE